jgi:hypothetical protein
VSLSVLGLIAALTLPSIFNSLKAQKDKAVFKETYQALAEAFYKGVISGEIWDNTSRQAYLRANINHTKWEATCTVPHSHGASFPCMHTASGGVIIFFGHELYLLDYNGMDGLNTHAHHQADQIMLSGNYTGATKNFHSLPVRVGELKPTSNPSIDFFADLMS